MRRSTGSGTNTASQRDLASTLNVLNMLTEESALVRPDGARAWSSGCGRSYGTRAPAPRTRAGRVITWRARPRRSALRTWCSTSVPGAAFPLRRRPRRCRARLAIEASDIAEVAERGFAVNGVRDRVTLLPGWSRQLELPERADLLVAELIGNEPLEEEILQTTLDARRRLLAPEPA